MPTKLKTQRKAQAAQEAKQDPCCVCLRKFNAKDEILFCSGSCQRFLHRYCASVSEQAFKILGAENADPFLCYCCFRSQKEAQIESLKCIVESLKTEIDALKARPVSPVVDRGETLCNSFSNVAKSGASPAPNVLKTSVNSMSNTSLDHERKYNIVLYGIEECRPGLSRSTRLESDLTNISNVFTALDSSIQPQSIRDCYRLGKYTRDASRPRPILAKLVRAADVTKIFANRRKLPTPISIKPDMSYAERRQYSILMQERWRLIQSGVSRKDIKIKGDSLYVSSKKHGCALDLKFKPCSGSNQSTTPCDYSTTSQQDQLSVFHVHTSPQEQSTTSLVNSDTSSGAIDTGPVSSSLTDTIPVPPPNMTFFCVSS